MRNKHLYIPSENPEKYMVFPLKAPFREFSFPICVVMTQFVCLCRVLSICLILSRILTLTVCLLVLSNDLMVVLKPNNRELRVCHKMHIKLEYINIKSVLNL